MKKKILVGFLSICLCVISLLGLTGCAKPLSMPNNLEVTSQGGAVVRVGDYIYFVNGFIDTDSLSYGSNRKNITHGALMRVKLQNGGALEYDANGNLKGAQKVVDKISGFSSLNLFVYDEYIYFSTPFSTNDKQGNSQFDRTVIMRAKLNGEKATELYTSESKKPITWSVYKIEGQVVIGVLDGEKLVSYNTQTKSKNVISQNVTSAVFPEVSEYKPNTESTQNGERQVYFTKTDESSIFTANLKTLADDSADFEAGVAIEVVDYIQSGTEGKVYYTKTKDGVTNYFATKVNTDGEILSDVTSATTQYTFMDYNQIMFTGVRDYAFATYEYTPTGGDKTTEVQRVYGEVSPTHSTQSITILAIYGEYIYGFNANNELVKISVWNDAEHEVIAEFKNEKDEDDKDIEDGLGAYYSNGIDTENYKNLSLFVDFDGDYMYFFRTCKNNNNKESVYLARVNLSTNTVEMVGQMEENHKYKLDTSAQS